MANQQKQTDFKEKEQALKNSERNARYFKAEYESMYYALEAEKIRGAYQELLKSKYPEVFEQATKEPQVQPEPVEEK